jgi:hypothetical protein
MINYVYSIVITLANIALLYYAALLSRKVGYFYEQTKDRNHTNENPSLLDYVYRTKNLFALLNQEPFISTKKNKTTNSK